MKVKPVLLRVATSGCRRGCRRGSGESGWRVWSGSGREGERRTRGVQSPLGLGAALCRKNATDKQRNNQEKGGVANGARKEGTPHGRPVRGRVAVSSGCTGACLEGRRRRAMDGVGGKNGGRTNAPPYGKMHSWNKKGQTGELCERVGKTFTVGPTREHYRKHNEAHTRVNWLKNTAQGRRDGSVTVAASSSTRRKNITCRAAGILPV